MNVVKEKTSTSNLKIQIKKFLGNLGVAIILTAIIQGSGILISKALVILNMMSVDNVSFFRSIFNVSCIIGLIIWINLSKKK